MARAVRWKIPFKDIDGTNYNIKIYDEGWDGDITILTGSKSPIKVQDIDTTDIFEPIVSSTGYISIVDTDGEAENIRPKHSTDRYVELEKSGNIYEWCGYIKAEEYSGDFGPCPHEVNFPIISSVEILKHKPYTLTNLTKSIGQLIAESLNATGTTYQMVFMSQSIPMSVMSSTLCDTCFKKRDKNDDKDSKKYLGYNSSLKSPEEQYTYYDVLKNICNMFGYSFHDSGSVAEFDTEDTIQYKLTSISALSNNVSTGMDVTSQYIEVGSSFYINSADNTYDRINPKSQIRLVVKKDRYEENIISLDEIDKLSFVQSQDTTIYNFTYYKDWFGSLFKDDEYIITYQYRQSSPIVDRAMVMSNILPGDTERTYLTTSGGTITKDAFAVSSLGSKNTVMTISCENLSSGSSVIWRDAIVFRTREIYRFGSELGTMLDLRADYDAVGFDWEKRFSSTNEHVWTNMPRMKIKFWQIGSSSPLYYTKSNVDGEHPYGQWVTQECEVNYSKTPFQQQCNYFFGCISGMQIPCPVGYGRVEIDIPIQNNASDPTTDKTKYLRFTRFDLAIVERNDTLETYHLEEKRYNAELTDDEADVYSREIDLAFNETMSFNAVTSDYSTDIHSLLLERMAEWYDESRTIVNVSVHGIFSNRYNHIKIGDNKYTILSSEKDYIEKTTKLKLIEEL